MSAKPNTIKIQWSTNYNRFVIVETNRPIRTKTTKYRKLVKSMKAHGWIAALPAMVRMEKGGKLRIIAGQHRFSAARDLGLPICYVVVTKDYNIPEQEECFQQWTSDDFAASYAAKGKDAYVKLLAFAEKHSISSNRAAALLMAKSFALGDSSGTATARLRGGQFSYTQDGEDYANTVLRVCSHLPKKMRKNRGAGAAIGRICMLPEVSVETMIQKIAANQALIVPKGTVEDYVHLFEDIYNRRNPQPLGIKVLVLEFTRRKAA